MPMAAASTTMLDMAPSGGCFGLCLKTVLATGFIRTDFLGFGFGTSWLRLGSVPDSLDLFCSLYRMFQSVFVACVACVAPKEERAAGPQRGKRAKVPRTKQGKHQNALAS